MVSNNGIEPALAWFGLWTAIGGALISFRHDPQRNDIYSIWGTGVFVLTSDLIEKIYGRKGRDERLIIVSIAQTVILSFIISSIININPFDFLGFKTVLRPDQNPQYWQLLISTALYIMLPNAIFDVISTRVTVNIYHRIRSAERILWVYLLFILDLLVNIALGIISGVFAIFFWLFVGYLMSLFPFVGEPVITVFFKRIPFIEGGFGGFTSPTFAVSFFTTFFTSIGLWMYLAGWFFGSLILSSTSLLNKANILAPFGLVAVLIGIFGSITIILF